MYNRPVEPAQSGTNMLLKRDCFGHLVFIKRLMTLGFGLITYVLYQWLNKTRIAGTENIERLPDNNVLFVANHQTYFADVIAMYHVFNSVKWKFRNSITNPVYLLWPRLNIYYIAAEETMRSGWLPRVLAYAGSVSVRRTFREKNQDVQRPMRFADITNIGIALDDGWVVTFPQGTTRPNAPGRRGVVYIIKRFRPHVIPVVIDGFGRTFQKKSLWLKQRGNLLTLRFKPPLAIDPAEDPDLILSRIMEAIEQQPQPTDDTDDDE